MPEVHPLATIFVVVFLAWFIWTAFFRRNKEASFADALTAIKAEPLQLYKDQTPPPGWPKRTIRLTNTYISLFYHQTNVMEKSVETIDFTLGGRGMSATFSDGVLIKVKHFGTSILPPRLTPDDRYAAGQVLTRVRTAVQNLAR